MGAPKSLVYHDASGALAYGSNGWAAAQVDAKSTTYYDKADHPLIDANHRTTRPLVFVYFLRSANCAARQAGLQPGDVLWRSGEYSLPQVVVKSWDNSDDEDGQNALVKAWKAAVTTAHGGALHLTVLRQDRLVELDVPLVPDAGLGVHLETRLIPSFEFDALVSRYGGKTVR